MLAATGKNQIQLVKWHCVVGLKRLKKSVGIG